MHLWRVVALCSLLVTSSVATAEHLTIQITNLTNGFHFTPILVAAHDETTRLFSPGEAATPALQAMAEGGAIAGLVDALPESAVLLENPAEGLLGPTESVTMELDAHGEDTVRLSVVAMLLPTNDAFMGLNAVLIPTEPGEYVYDIPAYDAGTEANNELVVEGSGAPGVLGIPEAPGGSGTGGTGAVDPDNNPMVHIHRSTLGDNDPAGGVSDLDSTMHRWLNPVARVTVTMPDVAVDVANGN